MSAGDTAAATPDGADRLVTVDRPQPRTAVVTLNRPDRLNAMSIDLVIELDAALNAIAEDNAIAVVVLTGAGRGFCSGLDVNGVTSTEMAASWLLPRLIGAAHSNDLLLTGRRVDAEEALRMGLVSRVLPEEDLLPTALEMAARMTEYSQYALQMTKEVIWVNLENPSLEAAVEIEDRNQLMLGFTENETEVSSRV